MSISPSIPDSLHPYLEGFVANGDIDGGVNRLLAMHDNHHTHVHVKAVAAKAKGLALVYGGDPEVCETAGWLHDISAIVPNAKRIELSKALGLDVLPEEESFPMIIHQKLSMPIATHGFGVTDERVLSAIGCHTTLKRDPSLEDIIVFTADKIAWDQPGSPPYIEELTAALGQSIEAAALVYLNYLWEMREKLRVLHPWTVDGRDYLLQHLSLN